MKKNLILSSMFMLLTFGVNAQDKHVIKTNPLTMSFGFFNVCYEKVLTEKSSLELSAYALYRAFGDEDVSGIAFGVGYRRYFTKKRAPKGFYAMPVANLLLANEGSAVWIGVPLGYQWVWSSGFSLDLGIGPSIMVGGDGDDSGIGPYPVASIGYAF